MKTFCFKILAMDCNAIHIYLFKLRTGAGLNGIPADHLQNSWRETEHATKLQLKTVFLNVDALVISSLAEHFHQKHSAGICTRHGMYMCITGILIASFCKMLITLIS